MVTIPQNRFVNADSAASMLLIAPCSLNNLVHQHVVGSCDFTVVVDIYLGLQPPFSAQLIKLLAEQHGVQNKIARKVSIGIPHEAPSAEVTEHMTLWLSVCRNHNGMSGLCATIDPDI